jgi:DNA repair protein RadA/Sms
VAAVLSSNADIAIEKNLALSGEVGLSGEVRPVNRLEQRIHEAEKLGFEKIIISKYAKGIDQKNFSIRLVPCGKITEVVKALFS